MFAFALSAQLAVAACLPAAGLDAPPAARATTASLGVSSLRQLDRSRTRCMHADEYSPARTRLIGPPRGARQSDADAWFAADKLRHFFMSFAATSFAYGAASSVGIGREPGLVAAGSAAATGGLIKEFVDRARGGTFSVKDLTWDAAGLVAALALLFQTR